MNKLLMIIASGEREKVLTAIMYANNVLKNNSMEDLKIVFFGPSENLISRDEELKGKAKNLASVSECYACKAISNREGISSDFTEIDVKVKSLSDVPAISRRLNTEIPELDWRSWRKLSEDFIQLARMKRTGSGIMIAIITLVAAVGLANTMVMAIHERTREIGALRAMGFSRGLISRIFLWEGCLIGIFAGIAALILGTIVVYYFSQHGFSLKMYEGMDIGYPVQDAIYPIIKVSSLTMAFVFGLVISVLASWGAAKRAARGEIVRALREGML